MTKPNPKLNSIYSHKTYFLHLAHEAITLKIKASFPLLQVALGSKFVLCTSRPQK